MMRCVSTGSAKLLMLVYKLRFVDTLPDSATSAVDSQKNSYIYSLRISFELVKCLSVKANLVNICNRGLSYRKQTPSDRFEYFS